jgi:hypothetical protein
LEPLVLGFFLELLRGDVLEIDLEIETAFVVYVKLE